MTPNDIKRVVEGLTEAQRSAIIGAKREGPNFRMALGASRGLHSHGVVFRSFDGHFLTETGIAVRAYFEGESK